MPGSPTEKTWNIDWNDIKFNENMDLNLSLIVLTYN